jgi:RNA polymerase sigma-70 factor, ECF subfamily
MESKYTMKAITQGAMHLAFQITGCREEAKDVLQQAVIKSLEHKNAPKPKESGFKAWFYRVVHNQSIDSLRRSNKYQDSPEALEVATGALTLDESFSLEQRKQKLHIALEKISHEHREIVCLKDFHQCSYDDIAIILSIEKGTVMSRLHRARLALKQQLLDLGIN